MTRSYVPAPTALVQDGDIAFGTFSTPFQRVNALDANLAFGLPIPRSLKAFRLKEWQAFQIGHPRYFINVALFNAKTLALVQVKIFDRMTQTKTLIERKVAPWRLKAPSNLLDSEMTYQSKGCAVSFRNRLRQDEITIQLDIAATKTTPRVIGQLVAHAHQVDPLVVSIPFGNNHGMYSQKGLLPVSGTLELDGTPIVFDPQTCCLLMDDHKGYYPISMQWDWATAGEFQNGTLTGFNLTRNQSIDPVEFNENALWIDGKVHLLPPVNFERNERGKTEYWTISDNEGHVDLTFVVVVDGRIDINALVMRSKYRGPFGTFSGTINAPDGASATFDNTFGMAEDFYLRC